jgi:predicted ATPase
MSSGPQSENGSEHEERPRLASVKIGGWPGLGGNAGFDLGERVTVLVGKNGAGKSLIMEGLHEAANSVLFGTDTVSSPKFFRCKVARHYAPNFSYEFKIKTEEAAETIDPEETEPLPERLIWNERCWLDGAEEDLWRVRNAQLRLRGGARRPFTHDEGLVPRAILAKPDIEDMPREAKELAAIFQGLHIVAAGIPRGDGGRQEILLRRKTLSIGKRKSVFWQAPNGVMNTISALAASILRMKSNRSGAYEEFVEIMQQLGVVECVTIQHYDDRTRAKVSYASVEFDGVNIGLCSDGTQRIAQIIAQLLSRRIRCLLIEEPETAVHPSLLARLLAILESYSLDRQIIIATHSPQIVDWCKPKDLRLVERVNEQTRVRKLDEKELGRVYNYLTHDGTLSDFVYGQSLE